MPVRTGRTPGPTAPRDPCRCDGRRAHRSRPRAAPAGSRRAGRRARSERLRGAPRRPAEIRTRGPCEGSVGKPGVRRASICVVSDATVTVTRPIEFGTTGFYPAFSGAENARRAEAMGFDIQGFSENQLARDGLLRRDARRGARDRAHPARVRTGELRHAQPWRRRRGDPADPDPEQRSRGVRGRERRLCARGRRAEAPAHPGDGARPPEPADVAARWRGAVR